MLAKYFPKFFKMSNSSVAPVDTLAAENEAEMVSKKDFLDC